MFSVPSVVNLLFAAHKAGRAQNFSPLSQQPLPRCRHIKHSTLTRRLALLAFLGARWRPQ